MDIITPHCNGFFVPRVEDCLPKRYTSCIIHHILCKYYSFRLGTEMELIAKARETVLYMEKDLATPGNILFTDHEGMKTLSPEGVVWNVTVNISDFHYKGRDWSSETYITAFHQLSHDIIAIAGVADSMGCIHMYNRTSNAVDDVIGHCDVSGYEDGYDAYFGEFYQISTETRDSKYLLVTDQDSYTLRAIDLHRDYYTYTVHDFYPAKKCPFFTQLDNTLYLNCYRDSDRETFIERVSFLPIDSILDDRQVEIDRNQVDVSTLIRNRDVGYKDGPFSTVQFNTPQAIIHLGENRLLLADEHNNVLREINLKTETVSSVCNSRNRNIPGDMTSCSLQGPTALLIADDSLIIGSFGSISRISLINDTSSILTGL